MGYTLEHLTVRVIPPNAIPYKFATRTLRFATDAHFEASILCDDEKALFWINGQPAGAKGYPLPSDAALVVDLPPWATDQRFVLAKFLAGSAEEALKIRTRKISNRQPKPTRRLVQRPDFMQSLKREVDQLRDILELISLGKLHHLIGLSSRLRSLICYMKNRNALPLLQSCAAFQRQRLPVFVLPPHWASFENDADIEGADRIFSKNWHPGLVCLDLDVWLTLPGYRHMKKIFTNNDVIRNYAETLGGAHYDHSIDSDFQEMRRFEYKGQLNGLVSPSDEQYLTDVGLVVYALGKQIVEGEPSAELGLATS